MPTLAYYDEGGEGMHARIAISDASESDSIQVRIQWSDGLPWNDLSIVIPNAREFLTPVMEHLDD